jgi:DNA-binding transcriptional LysR family regulator
VRPPPPRSPIWNWLPTFLAVAETQSVARSAHALGLTPQAVSRTVLLLEDYLGIPLFERRGKRLSLNAAGARLRDATRHAKERVEAALVDLHGEPYGGPLRIASLGVLTEHFVVPALVDLKRERSEVRPVHKNLRPGEANAELAQGRVDAAFYYEALSAEGVLVERIGSTSSAVYCGRGHPLFKKRRVRLEDVLEHPFSVPEMGDSGRIMDGWPPGLSRHIGMEITLLRSNLYVCASGTLLTVLPDITALPLVREGNLRRLPEPALSPIDVFAARRAGVPSRASVMAVIEHVKARLVRAERELATRWAGPRKRSQPA